MRKTQSIAKTSFKGIVDLDSEKLPEKKSRSRSIRDRNNTTSNQFSVSRATEHQHSEMTQSQTRNRQATWAEGNGDKFYSKNSKLLKKPEEGVVKFEDNLSSNLSNKSHNQKSIQKIRENMRKESQKLKQKVRQRSNSRRRKHSGVNSNNSRSKQNSRQSHANRFPNPLTKPQPSYHNESPLLNEEESSAQQIQQKQALNQIINLKNHLNSLQNNYSTFARQLNLTNNKENMEFNLLDVTSGENIVGQHMSELKQKAEDLNNIVETFHINLKENLSKTNQQINQKIQKYHSSITSQQNAESLGNKQNNHQENEAQIHNIISRLQNQFSIDNNFNSQNMGNKKGYPIQASNPSFFTQLRQDPRLNFSDLEKKLLLAEERLLK